MVGWGSGISGYSTKLYLQGKLGGSSSPQIVYICARILKAKYYPSGDLLDTAFPVQASPTWKAILFGLELLKKGTIWRVGNGHSIKIWRHAWIPRGITLKPSGRKRSCRLKWVSELIDADTRCWKEDVLRRYFYQHDVEAILN